MGKNKSISGLAVFALLVACAVNSSLADAQTNASTMSAEQLKEEQAYSIGMQAALWGYPIGEYVNTNYAGTKAGATHINYWRKFDNVKTAADRYVVTPNNVSIDAYGTADLTKEPVVINVPALQGPRWYIVQIGDMFDEIIYNIGGYKGPETGLFILTGPDYNGAVPANMKQIKSRTKFAIVANRIFVNGEADLPAARKVQQGFHMIPLSIFQEHGLRYDIPKDDITSMEFIPKAPEELRFFEKLGFGMKFFLSANEDYSNPLLVLFHQIGLSATKGFQWDSLDNPTRKGLIRAVAVAEQLVDNAYQNSAVVVDGWRYNMSGGRAGYDFALRAAFVKYLLGANLAEQLFYPNTKVDDKNNPLTGANKYVLHFDKDRIPPVSVFWNMAMYDDKELFIENDFKRYSIGSTTDGLKRNADGSIDIYIQKDSPGANRQSNWLPAPPGGFNLTMRMYGVQSSVLDGSYHLPPVRKVN